MHNTFRGGANPGVTEASACPEKNVLRFLRTLIQLSFFQACLLVLQCALHWCSAKETTYRLESFMRLDKEDRFLKAEWDRYGNPVNVSFTGLEKNLDTGT